MADSPIAVYGHNAGACTRSGGPGRVEPGNEGNGLLLNDRWLGGYRTVGLSFDSHFD